MHTTSNLQVHKAGILTNEYSMFSSNYKKSNLGEKAHLAVTDWKNKKCFELNQITFSFPNFQT